jgi:hypothetical protein
LDTEAAAAAATSHLGDPAAVHGGVGLVVARGQPGPRGELGGPGEATDVADLGDEHRGQHRPDPRDLLDRHVPGVFTQSPGDQLGEYVDLEVERGDQPQQGLDPGSGLRRQLGCGQQPLPARAEQVAHRHLYPGRGQHGMHLAFEVGAQPDQLGPVSHPATQLPGGRWGDPGLGQPTHPQQIGQVCGVALIFSELEKK